MPPVEGLHGANVIDPNVTGSRLYSIKSSPGGPEDSRFDRLESTPRCSDVAFVVAGWVGVVDDLQDRVQGVK